MKAASHVIALAVAALGAAAHAEIVSYAFSGVVTHAQRDDTPGAFSGLTAGDHWSYTMACDVSQATGEVRLLSAAFKAGGRSLSIDAQDLSDLNFTTPNNLLVRLGEDSTPPQPPTAPERVGVFDMLISSWRPTTSADPNPPEVIRLDGITRVTPAQQSLALLDELFPAGASADGDRWATISLDGCTFLGQITGRTLAPLASNPASVPSPAAPVSVGALALLAARRRR